MASNAQFFADLDQFADFAEDQPRRLREYLTMAIWRKVTLRTPVDEGRLRASWAVSDGVRSGYVPPEGTTGTGPVEATFAKRFDTSYIVSNLPYATRIEFGHSTVKAPQGMVRVSIAEVLAEFGI